MKCNNGQCVAHTVRYTQCCVTCDHFNKSSNTCKRGDEWECSMLLTIHPLECMFLDKSYTKGELATLERFLNDEPILTVNILRHWDREKIVRFAKHLLGDE